VTQAVDARLTPARGLAARLLDWEDWLTLGLALGATFGVTVTLEGSGWSSDMPALSLVAALALLFALVVARSPLPAWLAWPLMLVAGAGVTAWQTLALAGPGGIEARADAVYFRFHRWFELAFGSGISNDSLPFNTLIVGLTWLGVFVFGWALFRWHNAWLGLIPGGIALFLSLAFIDDTVPFAVFMYVACGFLLLARANLTANIERWRAEGVEYPPLISLTFLHYSAWAGLFLLIGAWIAPSGPFPTPAPVQSLAERFEGVTVHFARLAGPLHVKKIIPVHDYTAVLPFQGSIELGERELLGVSLDDPNLEGPIPLRGATYGEYASGGWTAGPREEADLRGELVPPAALGEGSQRRVIPISVTVQAKSVVGTVLFPPGQPVSASVPVEARFSPRSVREFPIAAPADWPDQILLSEIPDGWHGLYVQRSGDAAVVEAVPEDEMPDVAVLAPQERLQAGESYSVLGSVTTATPEELRAAAELAYPRWVEGNYTALPEDLPYRVHELAWQLAGDIQNPYDRAKAIESYLREFPVTFDIGDTPPGRDTVDYFLFEAKSGYFNYHASAMAVMLRSLEVPSRLAVGFVIDESDINRDTGDYVVRDEDAYAWVEVYFPGHGWVEFNPSPDMPAELRPRERDDELTVPPIDLEDIEGLPVGVGGQFPITDPGVGGDGVGSGGGSGPGAAVRVLLGLAVAVAVVVAASAFAWRRAFAGLSYPQAMWEKTVRLRSWAGQPPEPGQTPATFGRGVARRFWEIEDVGLLADVYNRSRFGAGAESEEERQRLAGLWRRLRRPLAWDVVRRLWRRG
jgi:transglutaminase-like putative cysteine protease